MMNGNQQPTTDPLPSEPPDMTVSRNMYEYGIFLKNTGDEKAQSRFLVEFISLACWLDMSLHAIETQRI